MLVTSVLVTALAKDYETHGFVMETLYALYVQLNLILYKMLSTMEVSILVTLSIL